LRASVLLVTMHLCTLQLNKPRQNMKMAPGW
jgi:hypothetical protein